MTAREHGNLGTATANLVCMASMFIWAAGLPAATPLIHMLPPVQLSAARMILAALALLPLWFAIEGVQALRAALWIRGLVIGGSTIGAGAMMLVFAQRMTDAVTVAVISATMPVIGIAIEVLLDGRRLTAAVGIGISASLVGGLMALQGQAGGLSMGWGALLSFGSVVVFTLGSRLTVTAFPAMTALGRTTLTLTGAALTSATLAVSLSLADGPSAGWSVLTPTNWGQLLLYSVGSLAISQILWIRAVGSLGIALASLHMNAAPFYVMVISFAFGGGWSWPQALAASLVGAGVLIAQNIIRLPNQLRQC